MADESESESTNSGGGFSITTVIFIILFVVLAGERLETSRLAYEQAELESVRNAPPLISQEPINDAGAQIAQEFGVYDPREFLQEQLRNGVTLVPIDQRPLGQETQEAFDNIQVPPILADNQIDLEKDTNRVPEAQNADDRQEINPDLPEYTFQEPFWGTGDIAIGEGVVMTSTMRVRREPAGVVVGEQVKTARGTVKDGPVELLGLTWWDIDFEEAPDGWVPQGTFSAKTGVYGFVYFWPKFFGILRWIALIFIGLILIATLWVKRKRAKSEKLRDKKKGAELSYKEQKKLEAFETTPVTNPQWQQIQTYMQSTNHVEWRQAILEADIMLDEMLAKIGYAGQSVGDKLKNVEESDFITLQKAWEAHKVRNRIAHGGAQEVRLDRREAERVIGLYEQVFSEFYYI